MKINHIIVRPIVTEKSNLLSKNKVFAFQVNANANKYAIAQALTDLYKVSVDSVKIVTRKGKTKRIGRTMNTRQMADSKIAYVKITKGEIDLFPKA